jgi:hypothetical protein
MALEIPVVRVRLKRMADRCSRDSVAVPASALRRSGSMTELVAEKATR